MNVYGLLLSISLIIVSFLLLNIRKKRQVLWLISIIMLIYKVVEYMVYFYRGELTKIPIEYSAIAYFIFSIVIVFKIKRFYGLAGFVACLSGFGYLIAFPFMGDGSFINHLDSEKNSEIVRMISQIGKLGNKLVIAESVEILEVSNK